MGTTFHNLVPAETFESQDPSPAIPYIWQATQAYINAPAQTAAFPEDGDPTPAIASRLYLSLYSLYTPHTINGRKELARGRRAAAWSALKHVAYSRTLDAVTPCIEDGAPFLPDPPAHPAIYCGAPDSLFAAEFPGNYHKFMLGYAGLVGNVSTALFAEIDADPAHPYAALWQEVRSAQSAYAPLENASRNRHITKSESSVTSDFRLAWQRGTVDNTHAIMRNLMLRRNASPERSSQELARLSIADADILASPVGMTRPQFRHIVPGSPAWDGPPYPKHLFDDFPRLLQETGPPHDPIIRWTPDALQLGISPVGVCAAIFTARNCQPAFQRSTERFYQAAERRAQRWSPRTPGALNLATAGLILGSYIAETTIFLPRQ
jgi:hypothetical protein